MMEKFEESLIPRVPLSESGLRWDNLMLKWKKNVERACGILNNARWLRVPKQSFLVGVITPSRF